MVYCTRKSFINTHFISFSLIITCKIKERTKKKIMKVDIEG